MNANEVIATLAQRAVGLPVHPNDHVNMSQSSNDVVPTAIHVAAVLVLDESLTPSLARLSEVLGDRVRDCAGVVKTGRTHLMDAMPLTLAQEIGGWQAQIDKNSRAWRGTAAAPADRAGRNGGRHGRQCPS